MRVNVYAEEISNDIEIVTKEVAGIKFTGLRLYLYLPVSHGQAQIRGKFMHKEGDDDSSAVTIWGKRDLRDVLKLALAKLDEHYSPEGAAHVKDVDDGWTRNSNSSTQNISPVLKGILFDVKFRDGTIWRDQEGDNFRWDVIGTDDDIIAYILHPVAGSGAAGFPLTHNKD